VNRIDVLRSRLPQGQIALISNRYSRAWLCGFDSDAGLMIVTPDDAALLTDSRYIEAARQLSQNVRAVLWNGKMEDAAGQLPAPAGQTLCVEDSLSLREFALFSEKLPGYTLQSGPQLREILTELRAVKDETELDAIRAAQKITDESFASILGFIKPGLREIEVAAELEYIMRKKGSEGPAFDTICVSGKKSAMPHGVPGGNVIEKGDFLTLDFGAKKFGYCSDMTRTVAVGEPGEEKRKVYDTVLRAHLAAAEAARPGMTGKELDAVARDVIAQAGYGEYFSHTLGHSLGLEIHESPGASPRNDKPLPERTVITIEPGIYIEGRFGVRIENMVLLTGDGNENLTASPRELLVL